MKQFLNILFFVSAVFVGTEAMAHEALRVGPTVVRAGAGMSDGCSAHRNGALTLCNHGALFLSERVEAYDSLDFLFLLLTPSSNSKVFVRASPLYQDKRKENYYPFGAPIKNLTWNLFSAVKKNPFLREGKEYIAMYEWDKYDFLNKTFDTWTLMALQVDPLATKYYGISPYALWANNPLKYVDPTGMMLGWYETEGEIRFDDSINSQEDVNTAGIDGQYLGSSVSAIDESTGDLIKYNKDGTQTTTTYAIPEATVSGEMSNFARTMQNPIVQAIHRGHADFYNHPATQMAIFTATSPGIIGEAVNLAKLGFVALSRLGAKETAKGGMKSLGAAANGFTRNIIPRGFKETKKFGYHHGQKVYEYKGKYYSKDIDSHNGGVWKVFEVVGGKLKRIGTADETLTIFKN